AEFFLANGVSAVIATTKPIRDKVARVFATRFYENFTGAQFDLSLRKAFLATLESMATDSDFGPLVDASGSLQRELLDEAVRGSFDLEENEDTALYQLHIHPDADRAKVANENFSSWGGRTRSGLTVALVDDPSKIKSPGVDEKCYLLCNRGKENKLFSEKLQTKLEGKLPAPYFFIIHDEEEDCPDLLVERFRHFDIPLLYNFTNPVHEIELPSPEELFQGSPDDPANPYRDKYKIYLSELYKTCFGGQEAQSNQLCPLTRRPADEPLLVVHHAFYPDFWRDPADAGRDALLQIQAKAFFNFYLQEFSDYLQQGFSERLIILFSVKYYEPDPVFPVLFQDLEKDFGLGRAKSLSTLLRIRKPDVDSWQKVFFREVFFQVNDFFKRGDQPVADLSFFDTQQKLKDQIQLFNRKKAANGPV
ncbi:MAG: CHAT domain-containing protein, partial [Saprospiraceae bacterium]